MVVVLIVVAVLVLLMVRRARVKRTLAGLNSERPTYSLAPPKRWSTDSRQHRL